MVLMTKPSLPIPVVEQKARLHQRAEAQQTDNDLRRVTGLNLETRSKIVCDVQTHFTGFCWLFFK